MSKVNMNTLNQTVQRKRMQLAQWAARKIAGRADVTLNPVGNTSVAGCVLFWYFDGGMRQFLLINEKDKATKLRFVSFLDLLSGKTATDTLHHTIGRLLGEPFYRSLDKRLLEADRVITAPTFHARDELNESSATIQTLVWAIQITPEQAELCTNQHDCVEIKTVPEFSLLGPEIVSSHKTIYQSALRHIHATSRNGETPVLDTLEDMLKSQGTSPRTLH